MSPKVRGWRETAGRLALGLLVAAWLWPLFPLLEALGDLTRARAFVPFLVLLALLQVLPWSVLRAVGAAAGIGAAILHFYRGILPEGVHGIGAWVAMSQIEWREVLQALAGGALVDPLQTSVFLVLVCVLYWLLCALVQQPRLWLCVIIAAVCALAWVDGNTQVHPTWETVVVLMLGGALQGLSQFLQVRRRVFGAARGMPLAVRFLAPLAAVLAVAGSVAWAAPKPGAAWANPFASVSVPTRGPGPAVIGYKDDVSRLGGDFIQDNTPVLAVIAPQPVYLRGEALSVYTGHGWTAPSVPLTEELPMGESVFQFDAIYFWPTLPARRVPQQITVLTNALKSDHLFAAYGLDKLINLKTHFEMSRVSVDQTSGSVRVTVPLEQGDTYSVVSRVPQDPAALLQKLPITPPKAARDADVHDLQLPPTLPDEVRKLALTLTQSAPNEYAAVERIEQYLDAHCTYQTQGIPVPGSDQDFVDQFLFETHRGYCTHFASAMAVLLRCAGIPARFVVGFTDGELDPNYSGPNERFIIRNADAHAWVEVYFPHVGWVPFDPTPGFSLPYAMEASTSPSSPAANETPSAQTPHPKPTQDQSVPTDSMSGGSAWALPVVRWSEQGLAVSAVVAAAAGLIFRRRLRLWWLLRRWRQPTVEEMTRGTRTLVRVLQAEGLLPMQAVTIRDLEVAATRCGLSSDDASVLIRTAESVWYAGQTVGVDQLAAARAVWSRWLCCILRPRRSHGLRSTAVDGNQ